MKKLTRNDKDRMIGGVMAGLADYLGWDVTLLRILFTLATIFSSAFPGVILYIILWVLMPLDEA